MARKISRNFPQNSSKGFSLVEMLVVLAIIAILLSVSTVSYLTIQVRSRDGRRKVDLERIRSALELYRSNNKFYPFIAGVNPFVNDITILVTGNYIDAIPFDPKNADSNPATNELGDYRYRILTNDPGNNPATYCLMAVMENAANAKNDCGIPAFNDGTYTYNYYIKNP